MDGKRQVEMCPATLRDLAMLLPRQASREIVMRHAMKLENWRSGENCALDLEVVDIPESAIRELCVGDHFGFNCGIRLAFFENALSEPDGIVWVIGSRREDEPMSMQMMTTLNQRKEMIAERK